MMYDLAVAVPDGARSLALIGQVLGEAGISLEGGGMWSAVAHYLVAEADQAVAALTAANLEVLGVRTALIVPLRADVPGELGRIMTRLAAAGVQVEVQYSDHQNRKVLVVNDSAAALQALG